MSTRSLYEIAGASVCCSGERKKDTPRRAKLLHARIESERGTPVLAAGREDVSPSVLAHVRAQQIDVHVQRGAWGGR